MYAHALIVDRVPVSQAGPEQAGRGRGRVPQDSHRQDCPLLLYRVNRRQNDLKHTNEYLHFNTILLPYAVRSIDQFSHINRYFSYSTVFTIYTQIRSKT